MEKLIGYDIDGVLTHGVVPQSGAIVISGRTWAEYDSVAKAIAQHFPVYIRGTGEYGNRHHAGLFKATMISILGVTEFYEDDPLQVRVILDKCDKCIVKDGKGQVWECFTED